MRSWGSGRPNWQDNADAPRWRNEDDDTVGVEFDKHGRVVWFGWNYWEDDRTVWQKLRDRVPWLAKAPPSQARLIAL